LIVKSFVNIAPGPQITGQKVILNSANNLNFENNLKRILFIVTTKNNWNLVRVELLSIITSYRSFSGSALA
jgi:hypothetical protein